MALDDKLDRNWLSSIVFADIVNYSSQSEQIQRQWKEFFNSALSEALKRVPGDERLILDTGDGAAICFLADPEAALRTTLSIRATFSMRAQNDTSSPRVRLGINLGSVTLVRDLNGNPNAIGDGINVAQRIMSFADPNQILVSRSYFDVISRHSDDYGRLFRNLGVRQDKHVREHVVYELAAPGDRAASTEVQQKPDPTPGGPARMPAGNQAAAIKTTNKRGLWMALGAAVCVVVLVAATVAMPHFWRESAAGNTPAAVGAPVKQTSAPAAQDHPSSPPSLNSVQPQPAVTAEQVPAKVVSNPVQQSRAVAGSKRPAAEPLTQPRSQEPVQPAAAPPPERTSPQLSAPAPTAPSQEELAKLQDSLVQMHARADAIRGSVNSLRSQQAADGLQISPEIASAASRLDNYLQAADRAAQSNDINAAHRFMDSAEQALSTLEARFGR